MHKVDAGLLFNGTASASTSVSFQGGPNLEVAVGNTNSVSVDILAYGAFAPRSVRLPPGGSQTFKMSRSRCVFGTPSIDMWSISIHADSVPSVPSFVVPVWTPFGTYPVIMAAIRTPVLVNWWVRTDWLPGLPECCP